LICASFHIQTISRKEELAVIEGVVTTGDPAWNEGLLKTEEAVPTPERSALAVLRS